MTITARAAQRHAAPEPGPVRRARRRRVARCAARRGPVRAPGPGRRRRGPHHARYADRERRWEPLRRPAPDPRARARDRAPEQADDS